MKLHYYLKTDSFSIELKSEPGAETLKMQRTCWWDFDAKGEVIGLDIDCASKKLDLKYPRLHRISGYGDRSTPSHFL